MLSNFAKDERAWVEALCTAIADNADLLAKGEDASFQNKVHLFMDAKGFVERKIVGKMTDTESDLRRRIMGFKCGILGLSNVGKSTVFNALTATAAAQASNYPFSTIEPNVGEVMVPDPRLDVLAKLAKSAKIKPTRLTFVDIAGLVSGASRGEGLGNQFLAHVREVDAVAQVVRCFVDDDVAHVAGKIDPVADIETIETELMLADLDSLERRVDNLGKKAKGSDKEARRRRRRSISPTARSRCCATASRPASSSASRRRRRRFTCSACYLDAGALCVQRRRGVGRDRQRIFPQGRGARQAEGAACVVIAAKIEAEIAVLPPHEREEYLGAIGLKEAGLDRLIRAGYALLNLDHLFHRRSERGGGLDRSRAAPGRRRRQPSSIRTSSAGSSAPKPSPTTTM